MQQNNLSERQNTLLFILYNVTFVLQRHPDLPPSEFFFKLNRFLGRFPIQGMLKPSQPLWEDLCANLAIIQPYLESFFSKEHQDRYRWTILDPEALANDTETGSRHCMLHALSVLLVDFAWAPGGFRPLIPLLKSNVWSKEKKLQIREFLQLLTLQKQALTVHSILASIKSKSTYDSEVLGEHSYLREYNSNLDNILAPAANQAHDRFGSDEHPRAIFRAKPSPAPVLEPISLDSEEVVAFPKQALGQLSSPEIPTGIPVQYHRFSGQKQPSILPPDLPSRQLPQNNLLSSTDEISQSTDQLSDENLASLQRWKSGLRQRLLEGFFRFVSYTLIYFAECYPILLQRSLRRHNRKPRSRSSIQ